MAFFDIGILHLAVGLVLAMLADIVLGSVGAIIDGTWDAVKFRNGCIKAAAVAAAATAIYFAGWLNPDMFVIALDGESVNLMSAVELLLVAAFTVRAVEVVGKLKDMLTATTPGGGDNAEQP